MKENIDLTEHRDFLEGNRSHSLSEIFTKSVWDSPHIPTSLVRSHFLTEDRVNFLFSDFEEFVLGDYSQRKLQREDRIRNSSLFCDCCGKFLYPWDRVFTLCTRCSNNENRKPWE